MNQSPQNPNVNTALSGIKVVDLTHELSEDPHLRKRGMFATIEHPVRGSVTIPAWPVKMSESQVPVRSAPLLGQHTEEVLSEWLGLSQKEIQELRKEASDRTLHRLPVTPA